VQLFFLLSESRCVAAVLPHTTGRRFSDAKTYGTQEKELRGEMKLSGVFVASVSRRKIRMGQNKLLRLLGDLLARATQRRGDSKCAVDAFVVLKLENDMFSFFSCSLRCS
jgi:hypothetical protein